MKSINVNKMKTSVFIALICAMAISACKRPAERTAVELLNDSIMEDQIYTSIINDKTHLSKLMDKLMMDENCKKMLVTNKPMVKMMCMAENIDSLVGNDNEVIENTTTRMMNFMRADSAVCDKTCTRILEDRYLKERFLKQVEGTDRKPK